MLIIQGALFKIKLDIIDAQLSEIKQYVPKAIAPQVVAQLHLDLARFLYSLI